VSLTIGFPVQPQRTQGKTNKGARTIKKSVTKQFSEGERERGEKVFKRLGMKFPQERMRLDFPPQFFFIRIFPLSLSLAFLFPKNFLRLKRDFTLPLSLSVSPHLFFNLVFT
jgi:hypothetical protein